MMTHIFALKDEKMFCPECLSHYLTFNKTIYVGDHIVVSQVYQDQGQAPFYEAEKGICKNCGFYFNFFHNLIKEKDIV